jgi:hypothetical protein
MQRVVGPHLLHTGLLDGARQHHGPGPSSVLVSLPVPLRRHAVKLLVLVDLPPVELQALGSARPATEERFDSPHHTTFDGRALAIVRPTAAGVITVSVNSDGLPPVTLELEARE